MQGEEKKRRKSGSPFSSSQENLPFKRAFISHLKQETLGYAGTVRAAISYNKICLLQESEECGLRDTILETE